MNSLSPALLLTQVANHKEADKEVDVGGVHEDGRLHGVAAVLAGNFHFRIRRRRPPILRQIRRHRHPQPGEHLHNLQRGDGHRNGPWQPPPDRRQPIVAVHQRMYCEVHGGHPPADGRQIGGNVEGVDHRRNVVVPVDKANRFPAQQQQHRVAHLRHFGHHEEKVPEVDGPRSFEVTSPAEGRLKSILGDRLQKLAAHSIGAQDGEEGEEEVPASKEALVKRRTNGAGHQAPSKGDHQSIDHGDGQRYGPVLLEPFSLEEGDSVVILDDKSRCQEESVEPIDQPQQIRGPANRHQKTAPIGDLPLQLRRKLPTGQAPQQQAANAHTDLADKVVRLVEDVVRIVDQKGEPAEEESRLVGPVLAPVLPPGRVVIIGHFRLAATISVQADGHVGVGLFRPQKGNVHVGHDGRVDRHLERATERYVVEEVEVDGDDEDGHGEEASDSKFRHFRSRTSFAAAAPVVVEVDGVADLALELRLEAAAAPARALPHPAEETLPVDVLQRTGTLTGRDELQGDRGLGKGDHLLRRIVEVARRDDVRHRGQQLSGPLGVGALHADHQRHRQHRLRRNEALGDDLAVDDAAEDVHEDRLHIRVGHDQLEGIFDSGLRDAAADVEEVGRAAAVAVDDVHGGHGQAGPVHQAGDVPLHRHKVEVVLAGHRIARVLLRGVCLLNLAHPLVAEHGVLVEVHLRVEADDGVVGGDAEGVANLLGGVLLQLPTQSQALPGDLHRQLRLQLLGVPVNRHRELVHRLGRPLRHLLNVHAALGRGDDDRAVAGSVQEDGQVELLLDVDRLRDHHLVHLDALLRRLGGDQPDAALEARVAEVALATPAGEDLRLDHVLLRLGELLVGQDRLHLFNLLHHLEALDADVVLLHQLLALVLLQVDEALAEHIL
ncbi:hypothetical protein TYRP_018474 [Tyrophagus putrescentiae]|nr:hypothetical protein TYRP_018474 [Tyrophagus putrescentiae]